KTNNSSIKIFPNPTHDNLNILSNYFNKEIKNFEIYNLKGELIQQYKIKQAKQSMTLNVPSGIYFYRILDSKNNIVSTGDIIVQ
ncbi:MAG: T9SS type A sorting domain-containing protein, partial [Chitinophagales bacterium]|nr:T9SS type A sorting domain-containing protein [Chitinophagales bacterium]